MLDAVLKNEKAQLTSMHAQHKNQTRVNKKNEKCLAGVRDDMIGGLHTSSSRPPYKDTLQLDQTYNQRTKRFKMVKKFFYIGII